jgi:hypothetical protein
MKDGLVNKLILYFYKNKRQADRKDTSRQTCSSEKGEQTEKRQAGRHEACR